jgi:hypothetical protein
MRHCIKTVLVLSLFVFTLQFSSESHAKVKQLTAAQCTALRTNLDAYIQFLNKYFGSNPFVQTLIAIAKADVDKLCPLPPPPTGNGWTADTQNECAVPDGTNSTVVSLGLDSAGNVVNVSNPAKILCISESACNNIVSQRYFVYGPSVTQRCSDPNESSVQHLSDAELQAKMQ